MKDVRIDKWLWNVRLFKSRTKANRACIKKKVTVNNEVVKPSSTITIGDIVHFKKGSYNLTFKVLKLLQNRRSYSIAKDCYKDLTPDSEYKKHLKWFNPNSGVETREKGKGRPTKRERRKLDRFKRQLYENK